MKPRCQEFASRLHHSKDTDERNKMSKIRVFKIRRECGQLKKAADISIFAKKGTCHRQEVIFHFIIFSAAMAMS